MQEFFEDDTITEIEVGMGPCADKQGHPEWSVTPSHASDYNCTPEDSDFFRSGYKSPYRKFFLIHSLSTVTMFRK